MMGPSPQCYIPYHKVIGPLVLEKKIFEWFDRPSGFGEEDLENGERQRDDDGRTTDHGYSTSSSMSLKAQVS